MTHKISFINYKGGVAKTTTAYHIACALAEIDEVNKVLLVDIDPQMNCTLLCGAPERWEERNKENKTLYNLFDSHIRNEEFNEDIIWESPIQKAGNIILDKLDIIPGNNMLLEIDMQLAELIRSTTIPRELAESHIRIRTILNSYIRTIEDNYDYIFFDCPPNLYYLTQNALTASDWYIIPTIPDFLSTVGLTMLLGIIERLSEEFRRNVASCSAGDRGAFAELKGLIFCRARKGSHGLLNLHKSIIQTVSNKFSDRYIFNSMTTEAIGFSEASRESLPVWLSRRNSKFQELGNQYRAITQELINLFQDDENE